MKHASVFLRMSDPKGKSMRQLLVVLGMAVCSITSAMAQVSVGIGLPGVSIGINLPVYPQLVPVPGYPVYYAPQLNSNYFFYDGMYWVYQRDNWYASSWYNGPWGLVAPDVVPLYVLRVPVRYYRQPPMYFSGWQSDAPPRWGEHWGNTWERSHSGWDNWNRASMPAPAPLPVYQRQYSGARYPHAEQQQALESQNYRYQPHDAVVQQHYQAQRAQAPSAVPAPAPQQAPRAGRPYAPQQPQQAAQAQPRGQVPPSSATYQRPGPAETPAAQGRPAQHPIQQTSQGSVQHEQPAPRSQGQMKPVAAQVPAQHAQQPPQGADQHDERALRSQSQDKGSGSQGKGSAQEQSHGQESGERQGR